MPINPGNQSGDPGQNKGNGTRPNTRQETKKTGANVAISSSDMIKDAKEGRAYLEGGYYLCPPGEPVTTTALRYCLHQISVMSGITVPVSKAVKAVVYLLEELEECAIAEVTRDTVNTQLTSSTEDFQLLATDVKEKIDTCVEEKLADIEKYTKKMDKILTKIESATNNTENTTPNGYRTDNSYTHHDNGGTKTYAEALISPPSHADPRLAAKEDIRVRQFMFKGVEKEGIAATANNMQL